KAGPHEMYDGSTKSGEPGGRYLTVTGHRLPSAPATVNNRQEAIDALYEEWFGAPKKPGLETTAETPSAADVFRAAVPDASPPPLPSENGRPRSDQELPERAMTAKNGDKFRRLWDGDSTGYRSESEADLALCRILAYWTDQDRERVERLFGQSERGKRSKWSERADYRRMTLDTALDGTALPPAPSANGANPEAPYFGPPANDTPPEAPDQGEKKLSRAYQVILDWFRAVYRPRFKRGTSIFSEE